MTRMGTGADKSQAGISNHLTIRGYGNDDGDNDDCAEDIADCGDDYYEMKIIIIIIRKKSEDIRIPGPDIL
ncbi:hypothetical protein Cadr_000019010 [Camelus dromedarius]|uniref:Uncharacterized protein n=1 Tax=Camelus dromedarius TaxID=9838 RepID=A0A5N4D4U8_CAMDR|nr:hypothetical protein Cadr_000019010 [Camelus dromedarius]